MLNRNIQDGPLLEVASIRQAYTRVRPYVHHTPLVSSQTLSDEFGAHMHLKLECLQKTGSFKPRGAFNKLLAMSDAQRAKGIVGASGGNHAQGLAYAARALGADATICMPRSTPQNYLDATRGYGGNIILTDNIQAAFQECERLQEEGKALVHPFDDPDVASGQGTVALEILNDLPSVTRIYISIGGGGLISGMATALKAANPNIRIIGVETRGADAMARSVAAKELVELSQVTSIARTLGAPKVSKMTYEHVTRLVDELVVVDDKEALSAMNFLLERTKTLVEPAASCCLAAARRHKDSIDSSENVVILLCGGNSSVADLAKWMGSGHGSITH